MVGHAIHPQSNVTIGIRTMKQLSYQVPSSVSEIRVICLRDATVETPLGDDPVKVDAFVRNHWASIPEFDPGKETMWCVFLNTRRNIVGIEKLSDGTVDTLLVSPSDVFRSAIVLNAPAIVLVHNHPSGSNSPSEGDVRVTRDLIRAGTILKISLLDHLVIIPDNVRCETERRYSSLKELGYFYN